MMKRLNHIIHILMLASLLGCNVAEDEAVENAASLRAQNNDITSDSFDYSVKSVTLIQNTSNFSAFPLTNFSRPYYSISPSLPSGLRLNTISGVVSGIPNDIQSATTYVVKVTHDEGIDYAELTLTTELEPPTKINYSSSVLSFTRDSYASYTCTVDGGAADSFTIDTALPTGLSLDPSDGRIYGTPTGVSEAFYTITATNTSGSKERVVYISIADVVPDGLAYTNDAQTINVGDTMSAMAPSFTTTPTSVSYKISPNLPTGVTLDSTTGTISGTPSLTFNNTTYTVTAFNTAGSETLDISFTVLDPATDLDYPVSTIEFQQGVTMTSIPKSSYTGGLPATYVCNGCPTGIDVVSTTGRIYGSTTDGLGAGTFDIEVTDTATSTTVAYTMGYTIIEDRPEDATYLGYADKYTYYVGSTVSTTPANLGTGNPTSYDLADESFGINTVGPPDIYNLAINGLTFNYGTGEIAGTPTAAATADITINGYNLDSGSVNYVTAIQTIEIEIKVLAPQSLGYLNSPPAEYNATTQIIELTKDVALAATIDPDTTGSPPDSYTISPSLPTGLSFNPTTGVISGTPTVTKAVRYYSITGTNSAGSYTESIAIQVD